MVEHLYALDFDGVLCDSCGEASIAGLEAAKQRWPHVFQSVDEATENWILERMHIVRPVVETGDDFLLLARLLLEMNTKHKSSLRLTEEKVLENWESLKPVYLEEIGESNKHELEDLLGTLRDAWITRDMHGWLRSNRFYPGVSDAIKFSTSKIFIVTTKESRFVAMSLKELAGIDFPLDQIYGLGSGPKVDVLKQLQGQSKHQGMTLHFVEDRLSTLRNVIKTPELDSWNLYLADWGYNTVKEREAGNEVQRIYVLDLESFCSRLK